MKILSTKKQIIRAVILFVIVFVILAGVKACQIVNAISNSKSFAPPPDAVSSIIAKETVWRGILTSVGSITAREGATLSAEDSGKVVAVNFESGAVVNKGDVIVELDGSVQEGLLKVAKAREDRAKRAFARAQTLRASNAISQDQLESADSDLKQAIGEVQSAQGALNHKRIIAPFAGKVGIRMVNVGEYLQAGAPVIPLYSFNPIYVNFTLPQQAYSKIAVNQKVELSVDAFPSEKFTGKVTAIDPSIDMTTRNISVQVTVENPEEKLRPGMFANITLTLPEEKHFITLPLTAINYAPYGDSVYVIEDTKGPDGNTFKGVRQQIVQLGERRGDQVAIVSGLKGGEEVVASGVFKLRPGAPVNVNNAIQLGNEIKPTPEDT